MPSKRDQDFVDEIKDIIFKTSLEVTKNVNRAAWDYLNKRADLSEQEQQKVHDLLLKKVPDAVAKKVSKRLNSVLGLNLDVSSQKKTTPIS